MRGLRLLLAAQVAFFALWGGQLLASHRAAATVWLATEPVDPRDLLSGHFVALRYAMARTDAGACAGFREEAAGGRLFVRLAPGSASVTTAAGPATLAEPVACQTHPPAAGAGEIWIAGTLVPRPGSGPELTFGIERFYVPETSELRYARSGKVVAQVAINDHHHGRIVDLVPILDVAR